MKLRNSDGAAIEAPCGQCNPCRITKRQEWVFRIMIELRENKFAYFVTLTYNPEHLPDKGTLVKRHLQLFWKKLRERHDSKIRYIAVGEYGDKSDRPHYHAIIFTDSEIYLGDGHKSFDTESIIFRSWNEGVDSLGHVYTVPILAANDALRIGGYIAGYTVKKFNTVKRMNLDYYVENGKNIYFCPLPKDERIPEFFVSSRRPGIGLSSTVVNDLVGKYYDYGLARNITDLGISGTKGVHAFRLNGKIFPVGRTLRKKIIDMCGGDKRTQNQKNVRMDNKIKFRARLGHLEIEQEKQKISGIKASKLVKQASRSKTL